MAATYGRLTGRPGVCIATLGPGALNLSTGAAYALLGAMPMVMITGQKGIMTSKQARFQIVDMVATMTPLTKMARQIVSTATHPTDRARGVPRGAGGAAGAGASGAARGHRRRGMRRTCRLVPPHPIELPVAHRGGARPCGRDDPRGGAAAGDAGRGGEPTATRPPGSSEFVRRTADPVLHDADGQGHGRRRHESLHGHGGALGAGLRARGDRPGRPDRRDRPRHDREAAVPHGAGRAAR